MKEYILSKDSFHKKILDPLSEHSIIEIFKICNKLEFFCEEKNVESLSAIQIGFPLDLFAIKYQNKFNFFTKCKYNPISSNKIKTIEGCLSLTDESSRIRRFEVERFESVLVEGEKLDFDSDQPVLTVSFEVFNDEAILFQHEIDHSLGTCISEIGKEIHLF